jgi:pseudomonalisin
MHSHFAIRLRFVVFQAFSLGILAILSSSGLLAQTRSGGIAVMQPVPQSDRIAADADLGPQTKLSGTIPAWVRAGSQTAGRAVDVSAMIHVSVVLRRDAAVQASFEQLLANQQNPNSPGYHQWLSPQQVGQVFGPTQNDLSAVRSWLTSQGLKVDSIAPSGMIVEASGTMAVVGNAFHTSFGYFDVAGQSRLSTVSEPSIPSALTPVVTSIQGLAEMRLEPMSHAVSVKAAEPVLGTSQSKAIARPQLTITSGGVTYHFLTPDDFAVIYDLKGVYTGGNTGATIGSNAQHIAIIGRSRVSATDISEYATNTGITNYTVNTVIPTTGIDPGPVCPVTNPVSSCNTDGDQGEATLDVDRVIGTAPGATTDLVVSGNTTTLNGIYVAAAYNVNTLKDPIMSISFGACEAEAGSGGVNLWDTLFSAAAAEGISVFVSSGDSGASGCVDAFTPVPTTPAQVKSINYICSSSYATCVGGTEFVDTATPSTYWATNNGAGYESALSYIPEGAWNEPSTTNNSGATIYVPASSGGGASAYIVKPSWQTGPGVPADGFRDVPDVSFSASAHDGYYACLAFSGGDCGNGYFEYFSGTSAAAPSMAGVTALLNTKVGSAQGNVNPLLYRLAGTTSTNPFHDITTATSGVTGCTAATPSMCNNSTPGPTSLTGGLAGYTLTAGYDQVTGLGSIDVANLLTDAVTPYIATTLILTAAANPIMAGQSTTFTATLTPASTTSAVPTGTVQFYSAGTAIGSPIPLSSDVAVSASQAFPTPGNYSITAVYSGDTVYDSSTSAAVQLVVNSVGSFTLAANPTTLTATTSLNTTTTSTSVITGASTGGFIGAVTLTCAVTSIPTLIPAPTCAMSPTSFTLASGGTGTSTLTITSTGEMSSCSASLSVPARPGFGRYSGSGVVLAGLLLWLLPGRRRRGLRALAMICLLGIGLGSLSGCGGSGPKACNDIVVAGTAAGTYTVTVTGRNGSLTATAPVTITVQ